MMKIGCHISISGGIHLSFERALQVGCESIQIFTQNQRQWRSVQYAHETIAEFKKLRKTTGFAQAPVISHASYLINMCALDEENLRKSRAALADELQRCDQLELDYLVIHPGSHGGGGEARGLEKISETLDQVLGRGQVKTRLLLETTAGQGTNLGYRFEHLAEIIEKSRYKDMLGVCVDTCHIFAAGYAIEDEAGWRDTLDKMDQTFGLNKVAVIHLNDSKKEKGSRRDRHAPLGEGFIGLKSFEIVMNMERFAQVAGILEIPGGMDKFAENILLLKSMR